MEELVPITDHELNRSSADIHRERGLLGHGDVIFDAQEDQSGFFGAADNANGQPCLFGDEIDKVSPVFGLTHGAGGHGNYAIIAFIFGEGDEMANDLESTGNGHVGQAMGREGAIAESRHVFEAIKDLVAGVRLDLCQHHMDGVRSDVDDGNLCHDRLCL